MNLNTIVIHLFNTNLNPCKTAKYVYLSKLFPYFKEFSPFLIKGNCKTPAHFTGRTIRSLQIFITDCTLPCTFLHENHVYSNVFLHCKLT